MQYSDSDMVFLFPKHKRADNVYTLIRKQYSDSDVVFLFPKHKRADTVYTLLRMQYSDSDMVFLFPKHNRADNVYTLASVSVLISVPLVPRGAYLDVHMHASRSMSTAARLGGWVFMQADAVIK
jgi:hypothetical protein